MARRTQEQKRQDGHWPSYARHQRGRSPFGRPVYGYKVTCECGWSYEVNGPKEEARSWHNDHLNQDVK